jgi:hypothetical protein
MPAPPFEIPLPPGFEVIEEPSQLGVGRGGMYAALVQDQRGRVGAVLCRQTRADVVRSLTVFQDEIATLADFLWARR